MKGRWLGATIAGGGNLSSQLLLPVAYCPLQDKGNKPIGQVRTRLQGLWKVTGADEVDRVSAGDEALQVVGDGQVSGLVRPEASAWRISSGVVARERSLKPTR